MQMVLVTGGAGYIGSHVCKALYQAGLVPIAFDNLSTGYDWAAKWGPLEVGDIRDTERVIGAILKYKVTAILHFAAKSLVAESVSDPLPYYTNNVCGTISLINAMLSTGIRKIVFSSTCAVYGAPSLVPITEDAGLNPLNPYGQSKLSAEKVLADVARSGKIQAALLRYFNAAGADPSLEIGEAHEPETHLIPLAIRAALGTGEPLKIFGTDYPTPDGTCLRDYVHVTDLAAAHVAALHYLTTGVDLCRFNLGAGTPTSVREVIRAISAVADRDVPVIVSPRRAGDAPTLYAATDAARSKLHWKPVHSDIRTIISSALAWEKIHQRQIQQIISA
jgi:UDP-arabinose 4-epimerase